MECYQYGSYIARFSFHLTAGRCFSFNLFANVHICKRTTKSYKPGNQEILNCWKSWGWGGESGKFNLMRHNENKCVLSIRMQSFSILYSNFYFLNASYFIKNILESACKISFYFLKMWYFFLQCSNISFTSILAIL